jgi:hypothetical protein
MNVLNQLSTMYSDWLDQQKIEDRKSADELYFGNQNLTGKQKTWLANFIETWEHAEDFLYYVDRLLPEKNEETKEVA